MGGGFPVVGLDDDEALATRVAGAKAAALARARRCGLPVLPGLVIPAECALGFLEPAIRVRETRGPHAARLAAMSEIAAAGAAFGELRRRAGALAAVLVVRSSARSEDDPRWAGAYGSVLDVRPDDLVAAIASCWSSALSEDAAFRREATGETLADTCPAVLVQPFVEPRLAGTATWSPGEPAAVTAARGSPARLLAGHVPGLPATVDGSVARGAAVDLAGPEVLCEVAAIARAAGAVPGAGGAAPPAAGEPGAGAVAAGVAVEWALAGERVVLLQVRRAAPGNSPPAPPGHGGARAPGPAAASPRPRPAAVQLAAGSGSGPPEAAVAERAAAVAVLLARYAGALGDQAVLPWMVACALRGVPLPGGVPAPDGVSGRGGVPAPDGVSGRGGASERSGDVRADFETALRLVPRVVARAWAAPEGPAARHAAAVMSLLAEGDIDRMLTETARLRAVTAAEPGPTERDGAGAGTLLSLLTGVGAALAGRGMLANAGQIWGLAPARIRALLAVPGPGAGPAPHAAGWHGMRRRTLRWQPFLQSASARWGTALPGEPASPGVAAGLARRVSRPEDIRDLVPGEVAVLAHPHPRFAPLLWAAAAVVTEAGGPAAHLMEVARSLRIPALCGVPPLRLDGGGGYLLCADGGNGVLAVMNSAGDPPAT